MKNIFKSGDQKEYRTIASYADLAAFQGKVVHPVYSTFALARDIEWTARQFVLEMCEESEEGIGTYLSIEHKSPAIMGEEVIILAKFDELKDNELVCSCEVKVEDRLIAVGVTKQKIFRREKIDKIFKKHE
jgi:fluoroacetyl-CoA thioesterase